MALNDGTPRDVLAAMGDRGFLQPPLRRGDRECLDALLNAYGIVDGDTHRLVSDNELCALYATAKGSVQSGAKVAARIGAKYGVNPLLDPVTTRPVQKSDPYKLAEPVLPVRQPEPPKSATPSDMSQYATKVELRDLRTDVIDKITMHGRDIRSDWQRANADLKKDLTDTLLALTDAFPQTVRLNVEEALKALTPTILHVVMPSEAPTVIGMVHNRLPVLIKMLAAGGHVYLHGPAGSGKTTAARQCADAFGLPFYFAAKVESEYMLLGFKDARGETVRTQFREAYEHGGVFLFDELDGSSPSAVVAMNAALANGICPFPDGVITMHANFKCVGGGNTKLSGATREYVGRNQLDAASVDRFDFLEWGYDDALERALATNAAWCDYVQDARRAVAERALKHLVTPRATLRGCKLLEGGLTWQEVETAVIWKGLDADTVAQLKGAMTVKPPKPVEIL